MGIEPTNHCSHSSPTGFEDQARHQTRSTSAADYITRISSGFPRDFIALVGVLT